MAAPSRREKEKQQARRTNARDWARQQERGDQGCISLPEGVEFLKLTPGTHEYDFLPYIAGKHNKRADEGFEHFELEYEAHRIPVPSGNKMILCRKTIGKKCACCDFLDSKGNTIPQDMQKDMRAKTRHLWIAKDKPGRADGQIKVLDTSHYNRGVGFGELIVEAINAVSHETDNPFTLSEGYTVRMVVKEQVTPQFKYNAATRIDLIPRRRDLPEDLLEKVPCLDDCLVDPGYEEVLKMLETGSDSSDTEDEDEEKESSHARNGSAPSRRAAKEEDDEDEDEEAPRSRKPVSKAKDEDEDEEEEEDEKGEKTAEQLGIEKGMKVSHPQHGVCTVIHISGDGTSLRLKDPDNEVFSGIDPNDLVIVRERKKADPDEDEDEEEDEKPARGRKPVGKKADPDEDEEEEEEEELDDDLPSDDDDDEEEEEEPVAKKPRGRPRKS